MSALHRPLKAFDSVPRSALWAILSKFGFPHHSIYLVVRLHTNAKVEFTIGDTESEVESHIGVRQGSCEGPALFLFIIQAALRPWTGLSRNLSSAHERKARLWGSDQGAYEE